MNPRDVAYCPHCSNTTPQDLEATFVALHFRDGAHNYFLTRCGTCNEGLLYRHVDPTDSVPQTSQGRFSLANYELVWPRTGALHQSVPDNVRRCYEEAASIKRRAPNAFANQIRRALESLCQNRGATKRTLAENLRELAGRGEIPQVLSEMTDILRMFGNIGSHAAEESVRPDDVDAIDDFFRAVVEYVYVAPFRVNEVRTQIDQARARRLSGGAGPAA